MKRLLVLVMGIALFLLAFFPILTIDCEGERLCALPLFGDKKISVRFVHSVQKTPVEENLRCDMLNREFVLESTRYQSFGVGLPFMESEGDFRREGDFFVFDKMNRHFKSLSLRTGLGTKLTVSVSGDEIRLYEKYPPGARIDLGIFSLWELVWR